MKSLVIPLYHCHSQIIWNLSSANFEIYTFQILSAKWESLLFCYDLLYKFFSYFNVKLNVTFLFQSFYYL